MSSKARDFYHIQDELILAWRYLARSQVSSSIELDALSTEIESTLQSLKPCTPEVKKFIDLTYQKISLLESAVKSEVVRAEEVRNPIDLVRRRVEVSLSSSGAMSMTGAGGDGDVSLSAGASGASGGGSLVVSAGAGLTSAGGSMTVVSGTSSSASGGDGGASLLIVTLVSSPPSREQSA